MAPSYDAFIASSKGARLQWEARKFRGTWPNIAESKVRRLALARGGAVDVERTFMRAPTSSSPSGRTTSFLGFGGISSTALTSQATLTHQTLY